jgi:hypothetical protein
MRHSPSPALARSDGSAASGQHDHSLDRSPNASASASRSHSHSRSRSPGAAGHRSGSEGERRAASAEASGPEEADEVNSARSGQASRRHSEASVEEAATAVPRARGRLNGGAVAKVQNKPPPPPGSDSSR